MQSAYEIRASTIHGLGLFALRSLTAGDLILHEQVVLNVAKTQAKEMADPLHVYEAFEKLPFDDQEQVLQLTENRSEPNSDQGEDSFVSLTEPERSRTISVASKFMNNAFADEFHQWLSTDTSRINHSCQPNAATHREGAKQTIRAIKSIARGDEILISYSRLVDCSAAERRERLSAWNIHCICEACSRDTEQLTTIGWVRRRG